MSDVVSEAERLDGICIAAHIDRERTGFDKFAPGFQNWKRDILTNSGLYGLECDSKESLVWFSDHDEPGASGAERKKLLDARTTVSGLSGRHQLAHLQGSDSHSMIKFENPDPSKPWTRIKMAELTFDALRVALIDPTARVCPKVLLPRSFSRIRGMGMTGGFLHEEVIHFNDNLNCFIGGRGTGKSTAIRALAYAFGINDGFADYDNCPDSVAVYCEDDNGMVYKYERARNGDVQVSAKEDRAVTEMPIDSFRIEYFGQGELAKVAEDPLGNPQIFQEFLDRQTNLNDLTESEATLLGSLRINAAKLTPLEKSHAELGEKKRQLADIQKRLDLAEQGKLKEVIAAQSKIGAEKIVKEAVDRIAAEYKAGLTFENLRKDFDKISATAGAFTEDDQSKNIISEIKSTLQTGNRLITEKESEINATLRSASVELSRLAAELKTSYQRLELDVSSKVAALKDKGIVSDMTSWNALLKQRQAVATQITQLELQMPELDKCRAERKEILEKVRTARDEMAVRRKRQLAAINSNLKTTINDYVIFVHYDPSGITAEFEAFLQDKLTGTYVHDSVILEICKNVTPQRLAELLIKDDLELASKETHVAVEPLRKLFGHLKFWSVIFDLQALAKHPKPVITVTTKGGTPKPIPVIQLSDGQRHTILLTIALLAESSVPLVIDQPEDDLDNAFIFSSIVATLRTIKERRQVILVTHNANIAVLGDSELILPMFREQDRGKVKDRGSIDTKVTKDRVQGILEGGAEAFLRRKEMYNH
jgi:energy-coupling factor transporter ATP-binding protein EcfA2